MDFQHEFLFMATARVYQQIPKSFITPFTHSSSSFRTELPIQLWMVDYFHFTGYIYLLIVTTFSYPFSLTLFLFVQQQLICCVGVVVVFFSVILFKNKIPKKLLIWKKRVRKSPKKRLTNSHIPIIPFQHTHSLCTVRAETTAYTEIWSMCPATSKQTVNFYILYADIICTGSESEKTTLTSTATTTIISDKSLILYALHKIRCSVCLLYACRDASRHALFSIRDRAACRDRDTRDFVYVTLIRYKSRRIYVLI